MTRHQTEISVVGYSNTHITKAQHISKSHIIENVAEINQLVAPLHANTQVAHHQFTHHQVTHHQVTRQQQMCKAHPHSHCGKRLRGTEERTAIAAQPSPPLLKRSKIVHCNGMVADCFGRHLHRQRTEMMVDMCLVSATMDAKQRFVSMLGQGRDPSATYKDGAAGPAEKYVALLRQQTPFDELQERRKTNARQRIKLWSSQGNGAKVQKTTKCYRRLFTIQETEDIR